MQEVDGAMNYFLIALVSFGLGITAKYADFVDEHGLTEHFKGAGILSGVLWGLFGVAMVYLSPLGGLTYVAHVLYWFYRVKLEFPNHAIAGVMMVLAGFFFQGQFYFENRLDLIGVFLLYLSTGYIQTYFKTNYPQTRKFWRLRLRIYAIPVGYSLFTLNVEPIICTGFGMIGCELMNLIFKDYQNDVRDRQGNPLPTSLAGRAE